MPSPLWTEVTRPESIVNFIRDRIKVPAGHAVPGRLRLYKYQEGIAEAIGDPRTPRVTVQKSARVGYTTLVNAAILYNVEANPAPTLLVMPTEDDSRDQSAEIDDMAACSGLGETVRPDRSGKTGPEARSVTMVRRFPGGSLRFLSAASPRMLRRVTASHLYMDEVDGYKITPEGNPVELAEKRTLTFGNRRKIVLGSTPVDADTSLVIKAYNESDQRQFHVPCPHCGHRQELVWENLHHDSAEYECSGCGAMISEDHKPAMVRAGEWVVTKPEVKGHAGFRISAMVSTLENASWPALIAEYRKGVRQNDTKPFWNTLLGRGWEGGADAVTADVVKSRAADVSLDNIPADVRLITAGVDMQGDRLEVTLAGHNLKTSDICVLDHRVIWGRYDDASTWAQLDTLLRQEWTHPEGKIGISVCAIDSGWQPDTAYKFAFPRAAKCRATKGMSGNRQVMTLGGQAKGGRIWLVGVDTAKTMLYTRIERGNGISFAARLADDPAYTEQVASEKRVVKYVKGQPVASFERIQGRRAEALDCLVYALAARYSISVSDDERRNAIASGAKPRQTVFQSSFVTHGQNMQF